MKPPATMVPVPRREYVAAGAIIACAALAFFLTHGWATGWDLTGEHWDAQYYFSIASSGYRAAGSNALAFLPGYPILLAPAAHLLAATPFLASLLTSSVLSILAGMVLYRVLRTRLDTGISLAGIALLAFSPFSIYLFDGYSEPAFFLAVALALLWLGKGRWLLAAAATGYAFLCRPYAVALVPLFLPVAWTLVRKRDFWTLGWIVALGALPSLVYCGYLYHAFGDPFASLKALAHWQQFESISGAWPLPVRTLFGFRFAFRDSSPSTWLLSLVMYFLAWAATLKSTGQLPARLVVYSLLLLICVYLTDALVPLNLGRHALLAFACCPAIAAILYAGSADSRWVAAARHAAFAVTWVFFAASFIVMGIRFSQGLWVS